MSGDDGIAQGCSPICSNVNCFWALMDAGTRLVRQTLQAEQYVSPSACRQQAAEVSGAAHGSQVW